MQADDGATLYALTGPYWRYVRESLNNGTHSLNCLLGL